MTLRAQSAAIVAALALTPFGCGGGDGGGPAKGRSRDRPQPCVDVWNEPANFARGRPGNVVRRLHPRPTVPLFAHVSLDAHRRCVVFLDTPSTAADRRFLLARGRYLLDCSGDCGQDVAPGAYTAQFLRDGTLPDP